MNGALFRLTVQSLVRKKRSSLLLFAVLCLSFAFATISLCVTGSIQETNREYLLDTYGSWYAAIPKGTEADEQFLQSQDWLEALGICKTYGIIETNFKSGVGIGTVDDTFLQIGRLSLQDGRFPQCSGEIAMEADVLSALGYDYTLGQEITFTVAVSATAGKETVPIQVEQTFTLCGVLREYADLWVRAGWHRQVLNSAIIVPEDAETLWQTAQELADGMQIETEDGESVYPILNSVVPQYHFTVLPGCEQTAEEQVSEYLKASKRNLCVNLPVFSGIEQAEEYNNFYAGIILAVTLLSVICIYAIRLQDEARQLATFRSIGITKRQLRLMLLYETLCLGVPALLLGAGVGALGTWALLRLTVFSNATAVLISVPLGLLAAAAGLWLLGVVAVRMAVFFAALRAPLTGRFHIPRKKARRYRNLRRVLIGCLSALLSTTVMFTVLESFEPYYNTSQWSTANDYWITPSGQYGYGGWIGLNAMAAAEGLWSDEYYFNDATVPKEVVAPLKQIPGVSAVRGLSTGAVRLSFTGMEDIPLANDVMQYRRSLYGMDPVYGTYLPFGTGPYDPEGFFVDLLVVDADDDWEGYINFYDKTRFQAGDMVLMAFPVDSNGKLLSRSFDGGAERYSQTGLSVGDTVTVTIGTPAVYTETELQVGGFIYITEAQSFRGGVGIDDAYTVVCSEACVAKMLDRLGPGQRWNVFYQGQANGSEVVNVYVNSNAEYLSTDAAIAELCARQKLELGSIREYKLAMVQEHSQTLILVLAGGCCIALVLLLILGNTLAMEAERQKRNYGILQALGMSQKQLKRKQFKTALLRGALAAFVGWLAYGGYCVYAVLKQQEALLSDTAYVGPSSFEELFTQKLSSLFQAYGNWTTPLLLTAACIALVLLVSWIAKRRLFREDLMTKLRDEH